MSEEDVPECGWILDLITPDDPGGLHIICTEDQGHADTPHSDGEHSWLQSISVPVPEPDTEIELP